MSVHRMLEEVKNALRPSGRLVAARDAVVDRINDRLRLHQVAAQAVPGGSVAKGTYLAGDHDIDIFVRFSLDYIDEEDVLADVLEPVIKEFGARRVHGSRDYFQFEQEQVTFEVIPVLAVTGPEQARNVTDMSPIHVEYFAAKGQGLEDEIRLAKQFSKSAGVYGAESYVRGLSGHVIDILVMHYGSFYEFVRQAASWKPPVIIDIEDHHEEPLTAIDTAKHAPLVVVDPVQPQRNAAAALSEESFLRFIEHAKGFVREPSERFFVVESFDEKAVRSHLSEHAGCGIYVCAKHPDEDKKDIGGSRIRKAHERIETALSRAGFTMVEQGWHFVFCGQSALWYVTQEHSLPRLIEHQGPPVSANEDAQRFRETHDETTERDGRLYATVQRDFTRPQQVVESLREDLKRHVKVQITAVETLGE